jgi:hypothetical protein
MAVNRERQKIWIKARRLEVDEESIDDIIKTLQDLRAGLVGNVKLQVLLHGHAGGNYIGVMHQRDETDAELAHRIEYEESTQARQTERDRIQYEHLKKKFEG